MSEINTAAFFGAVLKAVACTPNHNDDRAEYAEGVLAPVARIREFEKEVGGRPLTSAEAEQVLSWLDMVLRTKRTSREDLEHHHRQIVRAAGTELPMGVLA
ncbi:hypothetical protein [Micromonospora nigra]|uniref:hypothetical protein n=1 Tax=Micromonospora nigra TaxID=145857 RepID=UPI000B860D37|nr:hypothetical protein [Micromonospora nigra]